MTFKEDITHKIHADFGEQFGNAFEMLKNAVEKDDLYSDRVIRCIIFLANGNIDALIKYIQAAAIDTRDVMLWAEYEGADDAGNYKRLHDFSNPFE